MSGVKAGTLIRADASAFAYVEKSNPCTTGLDFLTYGTYTIAPGCGSAPVCHAGEEALLFCMTGTVKAGVSGQTFTLRHYDTLYVPVGTSYELKNTGDDEAFLVVCRAVGEETYEPFYSSWEEFSKNEKRIRHLDGKDVFLMFDVSEKANRLMAGYTIYEPHTRAYPAHNHTDQEEIYIFTKGRGAMEVYEDEKNKTFVTSVHEMDAVAIPILNYHPVFSQDEELHFIWCIAGERYWVGDKNKDFMKGDTDTLTT